MRRFNPKWFKECENWLEYSIEKDVAYCLYCYLFRQDVGMQSGGDSFVTKGFNSWNKKEKLDLHVGDVNSARNQALKDGLAFRGHDESDDSSDKRNFLEFLQFLADHNDVINTNAIIEDLGSGFFSILVDESRDISIKEQMAIVLHYVDKKGIVKERFLGIVHVADTSALSLKAAIEFLFSKYSSSLSRLCGQSYDGASNMQVTIVGAFYKRREFLRNAQLAKITKALNMGELESGQGLNQETSLKRAGDTHWGSHYRTILNLILMFSSTVDMMRDDEWEALLTEASTFCSKHDIPILNMEEIFVVGVRPRHNAPQITNLHHYRVDLFFEAIDLELQELNNRFSEVATKLLLCMVCLNTSDSFSAFDIQKLTRLAKFYPSDFSETDSEIELKGIGDLARKMVETNKDVIYPLVYLLVKLVLTVPVATTIVEISFSAMKYIKNELHNRMGDQWLNDCLIVYIEKDIACRIDNESIMQRFQNMKPRRRQL
ncbi:uncharacterized protein LOC142622058 [Castanea sativa]|uniref:uncharacterized protein LOC142622058 n=1 Tax=Castanea sativa TaxID=21020 RepID=UPI003F6493CD